MSVSLKDDKNSIEFELVSTFWNDLHTCYFTNGKYSGWKHPRGIISFDPKMGKQGKIKTHQHVKNSFFFKKPRDPLGPQIS